MTALVALERLPVAPGREPIADPPLLKPSSRQPALTLTDKWACGAGAAGAARDQCRDIVPELMIELL
jgi:hypothetical protein